jgi:homoserine dehydrogenase
MIRKVCKVENRKLSICMIGFGNAGKEFCRMLMEKKEEIKNTYNFNVVVTAISTRSKGALFDPSGVDLNRALQEVETEGRFFQNNPQRIDGSALEIMQKSEADVLIELSTLSIEDGQPAISHIEEAFRNNMHVITANKGPIAWDYKRLKKMADEKGLALLHETTVMDGTPIFNLVEKTLPGCKILGFKGILNTTTNFIMEEMEAGSDYEAALKEAQRRGFAEADPSMDIDGWDAAAKTAALINVLMDGNATPMTIDRTGISGVTLKDIDDAKRKGGKIKLLCEGFRDEDDIKGRVYPSFVDNKDIFSNIDSTTSVLSISTDLMGEICIVERYPEIQQTAYGVYSDLLTLIKDYLK